MKMSSNVRGLSVFASLCFAVVACSSKPNYKKLPESANAQQEISNLDVAIENSRADEVELLAPVSYGKAKDSLNEAKSLEHHNKKKEEVLEEVALGRAYLEEAKDHAGRSRPKLTDVIVARDAAISAHADTILKKDFGTLDMKIRQQTGNFEKHDKNMIKEQKSDYLAGYMELELRAIKETNIGQVRNLIDESVKIGAKDLTPKTLAHAQTTYQDADGYITQNRHDSEGIAAKSAIALAAAQKLQTTASSARTLTTGNPEEVALNLQAQKETLEAQKETLARTKTALNQERGENMVLASNLASTTEALSEEQELQQNYEAARTKFSPEEAEVYKQGSKLVIRLKGLEFAKAKAELHNSNFALLKKVDDVIMSFNKSNVMVEGHTDSTGGATINKKLSNERAAAVKAYLEANTKDGVAAFDSIGYGYEKPLASNKSAEGRAQNRRVDVVIDPKNI
jgi:OOP family OmpA-OmpF porin